MPEQAGTKQDLNYADKIEKLEASVKELSDQYAKDSSEETLQALERRRDALLHVKNLSKGDPKARAENAANKARQFVRSLAIA